MVPYPRVPDAPVLYSRSRHYVYRYSEVAVAMAVAMAERAGLGAEGTRDPMRAALLQDIGKLAISNRILGKPGGPTDEEYGEIKRHPKITYAILFRVGPFRPIAETAANHHEKVDGSGYHHGIGAEELDFPSRILVVTDIYDALSADCPYHKALPREKVLDSLREKSGTKLKSECVAFLEELATADAI